MSGFYEEMLVNRALCAHDSERKLVGLILEDRAVLRSHQRVVIPDVGEGEEKLAGLALTAV